MSEIAAAYLRVSTDDQAEYSPDAQLRALRAYAASNDMILPDSLVFSDEGISGRSADKRPAFQRMIAQAKAPDRPFSVILVHKFDRFARSREDSIVYKSLLQRECGVRVVSITETIDDGGSGVGMLIESISEAYAEYYSINLSKEVKKGMTEKARRGGLQSSPSFGYTAQNNRLVPVPEEADCVRQIFSLFLAGESLIGIAKWCNAQGFRTHRGNPFENRTVEYILRNPVYIGKLRWNPSGRSRRNFDHPDIILADSDHEKLIDLDTWEQAQARMNKQKQIWGYKAHPTYQLKDWLSGQVRCACCGGTLIFSKPSSFICNNYVRGRCAHRQSVRLDDLHEAVIARLQHDAANASGLNPKVYRASDGSQQKLRELQRMLSQAERKKDRAREAFLLGADSVEEYKAVKDVIDREAAEIRARIAAIEDANAEAPPQLLADQINAALTTLTSPEATLAEKNESFRSIVERCTFDKSSNLLQITYRIVL